MTTMEFQFRASDERRSRSPSPPSPAPFAAPSTFGPADGQAAAGETDEMWRQAEKARIRERILNEEPVHRWELEMEVRRELIEQFRGSSMMHAGGSEPPVAPRPPRVVAANSSSPATLEAAQVNLNANAPAALLAKRKIPDNAAASTATGCKKQKPSLTCTVCGIPSTSENALHDHLNGKGHKKKAAALAAQRAPKTEPAGPESAAVVTEPSGDFKPTKFTMLTSAGTLNQVTQMNNCVLCEACNVRTEDRVTMMCHLEGSKHILKCQSQKKRQATSDAAATVPKKRINGQAAPAAIAITVPGGDHETVVLEVDGALKIVRREGANLICELCDVMVPSDGMRSHVLGKKHKKKANASTFASAIIANGGKEAAKVQVIDKDPFVAATYIQVEGHVPKTAKSGGEADSEPPATMPPNNAAGVFAASGEPPKEGEETQKAKGGNAAAEANGSVTQVNGSVKTDATTEPGKPVKIQVEGKIFTVLRQENGRLSCEPCGVHGCDKDGMVQHLYTRMHWDKAYLAEEKELACSAAVAEEQARRRRRQPGW